MKTNKLVIAGVGARKTPISVLPAMVKIGALVRELGGFVRSGHADGADLAFEQGAKERSLVYLPWAAFGSPTRYAPDRNYVDCESVAVVDRDRAFGSVNDYHPDPPVDGSPASKLLARNFFQIMGAHGDDPVDAVVCWAEPDGGRHGQVKGGTGQAVRIARENQLPVFNLHEVFAEQVMSWLEIAARRYAP